MIRKRADRGREREKGEQEERHSGDKRTMMSEASVRRGGNEVMADLCALLLLLLLLIIKY